MKRSRAIALFGMCLVPVSVLAQEGEVASTADQGLKTADEILGYWSEQRMAGATPLPLPSADASSGVATQSAAEGLPEDAKPALMPGWDPASDEAPPTQDAIIELDIGDPLFDQMADVEPATYGSPPSNPVDYSGYGPYQRWTWYGRYLTYPTSVIGKLFFSQGGGDYVCSGTVINRNTVITAGHCTSNGAGTWSTNLLFCPSYNKNGVNPSTGCWAYTGYIATTSDWHNSGDIDRDYACFVTQTTGTIVHDNIGDVTGWAGWAVNWPSTQMEMSTGYPAASPFPGYHIIFTAAPEWYSVNMDTSDSNVSKYIGNDMTGGSSGGGWWLSIRHPTAEYPDVDGSVITDPVALGGPYVNGVNSHKRCLNGCGTPPSASSGTFWSEMGSPQFTSSGSDARDVLDILDLCYSHGGS